MPAVEGRFELTDHNGREVTELDFRGQHLLIYFGFTHCRVVCPRSLGKITSALEALGDRADTLVPLYISVDPERDTPEVMKAYLSENFPRFLGLTGSREQVDAAKRNFRVFAERKADTEDPDGYIVPHSAITYLIGPNGDYLAHFTDVLEAEAVASRLSVLLR